MQKRSRFLLFYIAIALLAVFFITTVFRGHVHTLEYGEFKDRLELGHIRRVEVGREEIYGKIFIPKEEEEAELARRKEAEEREKAMAAEGGAEDRSKRSIFGRRRPIEIGKEASFMTRRIQPDSRLEAELDAYGVPRVALQESNLMFLLPLALAVLLLLGFWFIILRQSQAGRTALAFGRSKARLYAEKVKTVSFEDVAGCEEAKEELSEIVDFLRNPRKYQSLGGRMPKGVLLVGPPGTGKTLIARAVAGEAKRPFFSLSGSEFVEMFVGVGAARVRDLFQQAKDSSPCIIFIDELDAVGRHRGAGLGGGHDEREQTLNQLLVEMDGFDANTSVIILAATNRPDVLDPALLRPGRFDRQVVIDAPDLRGREAILKVHARNKPFSDDVNLEDIAVATPGFTGADLANVLNEAALLAARRDLEVIGHAEVEEAAERVIAGPERKSRRLSEAERRRVAYHEAGHARVAALSENADPVRKISIIPRGHAALGYTMQFPSDDRYLITKGALVDRLKTLLAGRAAERLVLEEISTGAADDLSKASELARGMVCRYGMSESVGPVSLGREQRQIFLGRDLAQEERNFSEQTAVEIDKEVRRLIDEADDAAVATLQKHRVCLEDIAETLLSKEVLQEEALDAILEKNLGGTGVDLPHIRKKREVKAARVRAAREKAEHDANAETDGAADGDAKDADKKSTDSRSLKERWASGSA